MIRLRRAYDRLQSRSAGRVLAALLLGFSTWLAFAWGPGQNGSFDSAFYLDGARHLADGEGYVSAATEPDSVSWAPVIRWAPGFPALIALLMRLLHLPALAAAAVALGLAFATVVLASYALADELAGASARPLSLLCAVLVACEQHVLSTLDSLLSDLPFGALAIVNTLLAARLARQPRWSWGSVVLFAGALAAMFAVRYAGALYIPGLLCALALVMLARRHGLRAVCWNLGRVSVLACALIGLWIARNLRYGELPFGARVAIQDDWHQHAGRALRGFFAFWYTLQEQAKAHDRESCAARGDVLSG